MAKDELDFSIVEEILRHVRDTHGETHVVHIAASLQVASAVLASPCMDPECTVDHSGTWVLDRARFLAGAGNAWDFVMSARIPAKPARVLRLVESPRQQRAPKRPRR